MNKNDNSILNNETSDEKQKGFFKELKDQLLDILKHPIKLLPSIIISIIWLVLSIISTKVKNIPILRFLCTITYSDGGMFGGFFGTLGGLFGKIVFAAILNIFVLSLFNKKNPFKGIKSGFGGAIKGGFSAISLFLIGGGVSALLYLIFNITLSLQNIMISLVCALGAIKAISSRGGILFSLIFKIIQKISKGKTPSWIQVSRVIAGMSAGFIMCFPLSFIRSSILFLILGLVLVGVGILLLFVSKKKVVVTILTLLFIFSICAFKKVNAETNVVLLASVSEDEGDDLKPYRGRLTYHNGRKNKYGQPFPDLMDFDKDGAITWFDYDVQRELSHDPDWLDRPMHEGVGVFLAILTGIFGSVGGAIGASASLVFSGSVDSSIGESEKEENDEKIEEIPNEEEDLGPFIQKDSDGDLIVKDPVTNEKRVYVSNNDGTYTNPLTGASYTASELKESLDSRNENKELFSEDENIKNEAIESQRKESQELSNFSKELEEEAHKREIEDNAQIAHETYKEKMQIKYGTENESETRSEIASHQGEAEVESLEYMEYEKELKESQEYTETIKKASDVAIDVLAEIEPTGAGKVIKDEYTVLSSAASNIGDVMAGEKTLAGAITQTVVDSAVGLAKNHVDDVDVTGTSGYAEKAFVNVVGDGVQATSNELMKGKSLEEAKAKGSAAAQQGLVNFAVDSAFDGLGKKFGSESSDVAANVLGSSITKEGVTNGAKTLGSDLVKDALSSEDD